MSGFRKSPTAKEERSGCARKLSLSREVGLRPPAFGPRGPAVGLTTRAASGAPRARARTGRWLLGLEESLPLGVRGPSAGLASTGRGLGWTAWTRRRAGPRVGDRWARPSGLPCFRKAPPLLGGRGGAKVSRPTAPGATLSGGAEGLKGRDPARARPGPAARG